MGKQKRRTDGIHINLRPHEKETIAEAADAAGQYQAELVRNAALRRAEEILNRESGPSR